MKDAGCITFLSGAHSGTKRESRRAHRRKHSSTQREVNPLHASLTVLFLAMGNLLRALSRLEGAPGSDCYGRGGADPRDPRDVFVDFEDARPRARGEAAVYGRAEEVIALADDVLASLRQYKGEDLMEDFHVGYLT